MQKRKLQVFVSSTYQDLKEERQAAVEAILSAGHIPAGMELFAAGDQSQWEVIKDWISESDVYMLILGGRYGSIEPESGKSYTHLEYEFALSLRKPLFAVVITEEKLSKKVKKEDLNVIERENHKAFQEFKELAQSKTVRFWDDVKDIKIAIHETLNEYSRREELIGWIPGNQGINGAELAEEIGRLSKENDKLRAKVAEIESSNSTKVDGVPINEVIRLLESEKFDKEDFRLMEKDELQAVKNVADNKELNLFHALRGLSEKIDGITVFHTSPWLKKLSVLGIVKISLQNPYKATLEFTLGGRKIFMYLKQQNLIEPIIYEPNRSTNFL